MIGLYFLDGVIWHRIVFWPKYINFLTNHPTLQKGLLVHDLHLRIGDLGGDVILDVLANSIGLVVYDFDGGIVLLNGFEISDTDIIGEGVGGVIIFWAAANRLKVVLMYFLDGMFEIVALDAVEARMFLLEMNRLEPHDYLGCKVLLVLWRG